NIIMTEIFNGGFKSLINFKKYTDVKLICNSIEYPTHRIILANSSEFFSRLLLSNFKESQQNIIELRQPDPFNVFPAVLDFMYDGIIYLSPENVIPLLAMSDHYLIRDLQNLCTQFLDQNLHRENVLTILKYSIEFHFETITERCITIIAKNFTFVCEQLINKNKPCNNNNNNNKNNNNNNNLSDNNSNNNLIYCDFSFLPPSIFYKILDHSYLVVKSEYTLYRIVLNFIENFFDDQDKDEITLDTEITDNLKVSDLMSQIRYIWMTYDQLALVTKNPLIPKEILFETLLERLKKFESKPSLTIQKSSIINNNNNNNNNTNNNNNNNINVSNSANKTLSVSPTKSTNKSSSSSITISAPLSSSPSSSSTASSFIQPNKNGLPASASSSSASSSSASSSSSLSQQQQQSQPDKSILRRYQPRPPQSILFEYQYDFDYKGIIFWISTDGNKEKWSNPHLTSKIKITSSSVDKGNLHDIVEITPNAFWTKDVPASWVMIDVGPNRSVVPHYYTIRHGLSFKSDSLRTWDFQGSTNGEQWTVLKRHTNDLSLNFKYATHSWPITGCETAYRYFRILQTGKNSNNRNFLVIGGIEIYGELLQLDSNNN
ncbi:hypothetical protein DICPUDRAFT_16127, partial [Dictyostelium purpureum]